MVNEAKAYEKADKERREQIDTKNQCDSLVYQAEKQIKDLGKKVNEEDTNKINSLIINLKEAIKEENYSTMMSLQKELQQELSNLGQKVYSQASQTNQNDSKVADNGDTIIDTDSSTESK